VVGVRDRPVDPGWSRDDAEDEGGALLMLAVPPLTSGST
jgi:hypothetical protein